MGRGIVRVDRELAMGIAGVMFVLAGGSVWFSRRIRVPE